MTSSCWNTISRDAARLSKRCWPRSPRSSTNRNACEPTAPALATIPSVPAGSDGTSHVRLSAPLLDALVDESSAAPTSPEATTLAAASVDLGGSAIEEFVLDPSPDAFHAAPVFADLQLATQEHSAVPSFDQPDVGVSGLQGSGTGESGFDDTGFDAGGFVDGGFVDGADRADDSLVDFGDITDDDEAGTVSFEEDPFAGGARDGAGSATPISRPTWADAVPDVGDAPVSARSASRFPPRLRRRWLRRGPHRLRLLCRIRSSINCVERPVMASEPTTMLSTDSSRAIPTLTVRGGWFGRRK